MKKLPYLYLVKNRLSAKIILLAFIAMVLTANEAKAQSEEINNKNLSDTLAMQHPDSVLLKQRDVIDYIYLLFHRNLSSRLDTAKNKSPHVRLSVTTITQYTITMGFTYGMSVGGAFHTTYKKPTNTSSFLSAIKFTSKKQFLLPIQSTIWTPGNKYNFVGDWRYLKFPQDTYGFGSLTTNNDKNIVSYKFARFHEFILRKALKNVYAGLGYQFDHHWAIEEIGVKPGRITDFQQYGFNKSSTSSGLTFNIVYDTRKNSINPNGGSFYANLLFLQNSTRLGSNSNWNSLLIDIRKYIAMPRNNVLALWLSSVVTLKGDPPYLDLPGTGYDTYNNSARGYVQGRFMGKKYIDLEAEYRFGITKNGFVGGVLFGTLGSASELASNSFKGIFPSIGAGLRIKFNKFSNTNLCIDYGAGIKGSNGFGGNLGEVF